METLAQKYEEKIQALGKKKKEKLEALYGQLVSCGENLDTCKELMETVEEICHEEKVDFIKVSPEARGMAVTAGAGEVVPLCREGLESTFTVSTRLSLPAVHGRGLSPERGQVGSHVAVPFPPPWPR